MAGRLVRRQIGGDRSRRSRMHPARRYILAALVAGSVCLALLPPWQFHVSRTERFEPDSATIFGAECFVRRPPWWHAEVSDSGVVKGRPFVLFTLGAELDAARLVASWSWLPLLAGLALLSTGPRRSSSARRQAAVVALAGAITFLLLDHGFLWARERIEWRATGGFYRCHQVLDPSFDHRDGVEASDAP